jgi:hypothetical protein
MTTNAVALEAKAAREMVLMLRSEKRQASRTTVTSEPYREHGGIGFACTMREVKAQGSIAFHGEADSALLFLLRSVGRADAQVHCFAALGNIADLDESNGVGAFRGRNAARGKTLRQTGDLFGAAALPEGAVGALEQSLVLGEFAGVNSQGGVGDVFAQRLVGIGAAIGAQHGCEGGFEGFALLSGGATVAAAAPDRLR